MSSRSEYGFGAMNAMRKANKTLSDKNAALEAENAELITNEERMYDMMEKGLKDNRDRLGALQKAVYEADEKAQAVGQEDLERLAELEKVVAGFAVGMAAVIDTNLANDDRVKELEQGHHTLEQENRTLKQKNHALEQKSAQPAEAEATTVLGDLANNKKRPRI